MNNKTKKKKWIKLRHKIIRYIGWWPLFLWLKLFYGASVERFRDDGKRQYLILFNHQTPMDQFFVEMALRRVIYYFATEDIFSNGFISSIIRYLVAPIPIKKQTTDVGAVMNCLRIAKEGGNICLAPEGNRTYSGKTEYINPAIAALAKKLKLPIILFRIEGGYGVEPRWSSVTRKGKIRAYVSRVIEPEEYEGLTAEMLLSEIETGLFVDESKNGGTFYHKKSAEYMERAVYVCPFCGLSVFESRGDKVECKKCNRQIRYLPTKELKGEGFDFPFKYVTQWYEYQKEFINGLDTGLYTKEPMFKDRATVSQVLVGKKKIPLNKDAAIDLFGDRIVIEGEIFDFDALSAVTVLGRNKLNIYRDGKVYQLKGSKRFNALKYVNVFHRYKNIKENNNGKFLGL